MNQIHEKLNIVSIISGGAKGADQLGERYAKEEGLELTRILPDWKGRGKRAGLERNTDIVAQADYVLAFWDTIKKTQKTSKVLKIIYYL